MKRLLLCPDVLLSASFVLLVACLAASVYMSLMGL